MAMALRGRTTAVNIKLEMVMKIISTVVEFLQNQSDTFCGMVGIAILNAHIRKGYAVYSKQNSGMFFK